jgi:hypothetical protein
MHSYELHLQESGLNPDNDPARNVLRATGPEPTVLELYRAYLQLFSKADLELMHSHSLQDLVIEIINDKQQLWGLIYNLSV